MNTNSITEDEYISAIRLGMPFPKRKLRNTQIFMGCIVLIAVFFWHIGFIVIAVGLIGGCIGGVVGHWVQCLYFVKFCSKRIYQQQVNLHESYAYSWSEDSLSIRGETSSSITPWKNYLRWRENRDVFILYHSDTIFQIVPKKTFSSASEESEFRDYLSAVEYA